MLLAPARYLGGVPKVLLDFAKEVNSKQGPMEEQRIKVSCSVQGSTTHRAEPNPSKVLGYHMMMHENIA